MNHVKLKCSLLWMVVLLAPSFIACSLLYRNQIILKRSEFQPLIKQLAEANPDFFEHPYTFVVMLDRTSCSNGMIETKWWSDWHRRMTEKNVGLVFATSRADSAGLVYAAKLESVDAPVLTLSLYEQRFEEISIPRNITPLHFLVDSTAVLRRMWPPIYNTGEDSSMMSTIDSFVNNTERAITRTQ